MCDQSGRSHRYQLVESVFELLQTVDELVLGGSLGPQRQDALWWTQTRTNFEH